ncbi:hypothetical protein XELAEV_18033218mg [Xenopus laevis]|uniref:Uncharacterized protein n=1 Tax=Xenopus laevis TaxID=8355 RepID=A0A974CIX1_XENLA|nr:hypothetical protein XELAEV_18033218mg [Xenopus laevis]
MHVVCSCDVSLTYIIFCPPRLVACISLQRPSAPDCGVLPLAYHTEEQWEPLEAVMLLARLNMMAEKQYVVLTLENIITKEL